MTLPFVGDPRLERLVRATPGLILELNLERVVQEVAELARELLEARYAAVGLLTADNRTLSSFTTSGLSVEERARIGKLPIGRGILGLVIREAQVMRLKDLAAHPASSGFPAHHPPMRSFLGVPIVGPHGVLGNLYLTEKQGADEFSDSDVHVASLLASIVASAVDNARSHERTARLLDEVQQLQRSRERFFAMVNHELRNSLTAVHGWAEIMTRKKDRAAVPRGAQEILEAAQQAVSLVTDLLDLNRLDGDRLKPVKRDVDCNSIVRAAVQRVFPAAEEKRVKLAVPADNQPVVCFTDAHRVEQILVNLLTNAIRHSPVGGTVTVTVVKAREAVVMSVTDQGAGVAPELIDRIFDIYYTSPEADGQVGHGVGLPLARRLARLLGGDLWTVAQPGTGGRFDLKLPFDGS
ncbi:MAG: GAF domain-containing sensor histidine kinase [Gemmatimonadota bacterium]